MSPVNKYVNIYLQKGNSHELPSCFCLNSLVQTDPVLTVKTCGYGADDGRGRWHLWHAGT